MEIKYTYTFTLDSVNKDHVFFLGCIEMLFASTDIDVHVENGPVEDKPSYYRQPDTIEDDDEPHVEDRDDEHQERLDRIVATEPKSTPRPPADWASTNDKLKEKWFDLNRHIRDGAILSIDCPTCTSRTGQSCRTASGDLYQPGYSHAARAAKAMRAFLGYKSVTVAPPSLQKNPPTNRHAYMRKVLCPTCLAEPGEPCHPRGTQHEFNTRPYNGFYHLARINRANAKWGTTFEKVMLDDLHSHGGSIKP